MLITFFVFTTTISSPVVTDLFIPDNSPIKMPSNIGESNVLTAILEDDNRIFYYEGSWEKAKEENKIFETGYSVGSGFGNIIRKKQKELDLNKKMPEGRSGLMLLIKPASSAAYRNVIDMLDEALINEVKKYAIVELVNEETEFLKLKQASGQ